MIRLTLFLLSVVVAQAAIRVDGTDDRACYVNSVNSVKTITQVTISFWWLFESGSTSGGEVVAQGRVFNGNVAGYHVRHNSSKWEFYYASPAATFHGFTTTATFTQINTWRHIAFRYTYGTAASASFFIDGTNAAGTWTFGTGNAAGLTNAEPLQFGFGGGLGIKGQIEEAAGWNVMLTDDEIFRLAKSRFQRTPATIRRGSQMWYFPMKGVPFTTASGTNTVFDFGPYLTHGTPQNSPGYRPSHQAIP